MPDARLVEGGASVVAIMTVLRAVLTTFGLPGALYTDRDPGRLTPRPPAPRLIAIRRTQVGRALERLGIAHILGYSPQARGRSERVNGTLHGRLVNELRGPASRRSPPRYLRERFLHDYNARLTRPPADAPPPSAPDQVNLDDRTPNVTSLARVTPLARTPSTWCHPNIAR